MATERKLNSKCAICIVVILLHIFSKCRDFVIVNVADHLFFFENCVVMVSLPIL